ncbi:PcfK-like family protein [Flavobacterium caeni]|uniref:PcfK-like protein n=1 Tax=Flavobacterium caeni TaxID=490189 RepID=A0A1G5JZ18_9FLAO|nr:PcfK-like family protein [Flavobacterium caeni]SCY93577.1 PcfK-like protein [Flavobacterium caeni]
METTNDPFKEAITNHLQEVASKDELFANTLLKPNKNLDDCATYILNEVNKSGRQGFADDEIYNMAIHYYDEDSIEIGEKLSARIVVNHSLAAPPKPTYTTAKTATTKADTNQISLF